MVGASVAEKHIEALLTPKVGARLFG